MNLIQSLKKWLPGIEAGLKAYEGSPLIPREIFGPEAGPLLDMYGSFDGEQEDLGVFAGFSWLSLKSALTEAQNLQSRGGEFYCLEEDKIQENPGRWIPFAEDGGGSFLAFDGSPGPQGTKGQVITLDRDSQEITVLAPSVEAFCQRILESLDQGLLAPVQDEDSGNFYLEWHSGHLFNDLAAWHRGPVEPGAPIPLQGFWTKFFRRAAPEGVLDPRILLDLKMVLISKDPEPVDLEILTQAENLTELIIHAEHLVSLEPLTRIPNLRKLVLGPTDQGPRIPEVLPKCTNLKELTLFGQDISNLEFLQGIKLKTLSLGRLNLGDPGALQRISSLKSLSLDGVTLPNLDWMGGLSKLDTLELESMNQGLGPWIGKLVKLKTLKVEDKWADPQWESLVAQLPGLEDTNWPFGDLAVLEGHTKLRRIGIHAERVKNWEALKTLKLTYVEICGATSQAQVDTLVEKIKAQVGRISHGYSPTWERPGRE